MIPPKFPNVKALGAKIEYTDAHLEPPTAVVRAAELERILAQAPVVRGSLQEDAWTWDEPRKWHEEKDIPATHTARLLCVRPIVRDTAETKLKKLLNAWDKRSSDCGETETSVEFRELLEEARKLLEKERG